jgi:hypothetical protein
MRLSANFASERAPIVDAGRKRIKPSPLLPTTTVVGLVVVFWLVGHLAARGHALAAFDWLAAVGAATAYGTLALALVTWTLVAQTRADASGTLELARLAEREQEARDRALRRERIERIVDAVDQLVDAAIAAEANPNIEVSGYRAAASRLRTAIAVSGLPVEKLPSTELLLRTPRESVEAQAEASTKYELAPLLEALDREDVEPRDALAELDA